MIPTTEFRFTTPEGLILVGETAGPDAAPAVILLHGGGQTRHSWAGSMQSLLRQGYYVVNYDSRGHGESDWSPAGDYSLPALAADLTAVLEVVGRPAALIGASVGGLTSFYAVGNDMAPGVPAMVLVDVVPRPALAGAEQIQRFMGAHPHGFASIEEAADAVAAYNPARPRPTSPEGLWKNLRRRDDGRLYWHWDPDFLTMTPDEVIPQMIEASQHVRIPTLLVRGGQSELVDDASVDEMLALVPQTEIHVVGAAGHMIAGDRNDAFLEGILPFLARHHPPR